MNTETAHARHNDVETSHLAAASVSNLNDKQRFVLDTFKLEANPMTDEELIYAYSYRVDFTNLAPQSESGLRSRRSELVTKGELRDSTKRRKTKSGRLSIIWELNV